MISWTVGVLHDSDHFMACPLKSQGFGEVLRFVYAEAEAEKEDRLVPATLISGREQIICNLLPFNPSTFSIG